MQARKLYHQKISKEEETITVGDCAVFLSTGRPDRFPHPPTSFLAESVSHFLPVDHNKRSSHMFPPTHPPVNPPRDPLSAPPTPPFITFLFLLIFKSHHIAYACYIPLSRPYIGRIQSMWESWAGHMKVQVDNNS